MHRNANSSFKMHAFIGETGYSTSSFKIWIGTYSTEARQMSPEFIAYDIDPSASNPGSAEMEGLNPLGFKISVGSF